MSTHKLALERNIGTLQAFEAHLQWRLCGDSWKEAKDRFELALENGEQESRYHKC